MIHFFLFALFFVLFASRTLDFDLSLAPGLSVKNLFLYVIFGALAIQTVLTRQRKLEVMSVILPFAIYVGYAIFTWLVVVLVIKYPNYNIRTTLISLKAGPVEHLLVLLVYFYGISDSRRALWVLRNMLWLVIIGNVITVIDALNIPDLGLINEREDGRVGGTIGNSNEYAAFLTLFLPAIFVIYLTSNGLKKVLAGVGAVVSCLAFLLALSRGAIVGLVGSGILGVFYMRAIIPVQTVVRAGFGALLLCIAVVAGGFAAGYGDLILDRFIGSGMGSNDVSSGRSMIWGRALGSMLESPVTFVTGFGWNAYETSRFFSYATHNTYLNNLYNLGMVGVTLFLLAVCNVLRVVRAALDRAAPEVRSWLIAFIFGFLALLVSILFLDLHTSGLYVWAYVGITLRIAVSETDIEPATARHKMNSVAAADNDNTESRVGSVRARIGHG